MQFIIHNPIPPPPGTSCDQLVSMSTANAQADVNQRMQSSAYTNNQFPSSPQQLLGPYEIMRREELGYDSHRLQTGSDLLSSGIKPQSSFDLGCLNHTKDTLGIFPREESSHDFVLRTTPRTPEPTLLDIQHVIPLHTEPPKLIIPLYEPELPKPLDSNPLMPKVEPIELAPIVRQTERETVFKGYGNSHFSHVEDQNPYVGGFHVSTQVPGLGEREGLDRGYTHHDSLRDILGT